MVINKIMQDRDVDTERDLLTLASWVSAVFQEDKLNSPEELLTAAQNLHDYALLVLISMRMEICYYQQFLKME